MYGSLRNSIARPLAFVTGALCLASLLACAGRWSWACDLLVNFRTQYAAMLCVAFALALAFRRFGLAAVAASAFALDAWPTVGALAGSAAASAPAPGARAVRVVAFNVNIGNDGLPAIARYLDSLQPDVVVLEELSPANAEKLAGLVPGLRYQYLAANRDIWGVVILSRWPLLAPGRAFRDGVAFAARVDVDLGDRKFRLYGAHLNWPLVSASAQVRDAQLVAVGREIAACPHACVIVGDFNVTPWSSHYRDVLDMPGVRDCAAGRGLLNSWPASLPAALRIRIDQCLVSGAVGVADVRVGESAGSDHLATINDLMIGGS